MRTDRQTEQINPSMKQHFEVFMNYQWDNLVKLLLVAEFTANVESKETTKYTSLFASHGADGVMICMEFRGASWNNHKIDADLV